MKKIMILDANYPSAENLNGDVFVHTRVKEYAKHSNVVVLSFYCNRANYVYEGVEVKHALTDNDIWREYKSIKPDVIFVHFYDRRLFSFVSAVSEPVYIWVHGHEALAFYRRLFNHTIISFLRNIHNAVFYSWHQMKGFRRLIKYSNSTGKVRFVFVSKWMKRVCETDAFLSNIKYYSVIPNPIDTKLFRYVEKASETRKKILILRSFHSRKYANDIAVKAILMLSKKPFFKDVRIEIYGMGQYFDILTKPLLKFDNVFLHKHFVENRDIPSVHEKFGIFLCPTRQDAQGVSMCEAMSSGLVPISSFSTAIPEFVDDGETGILTNNAFEIANNIERLYNDHSLFLRLSRQASYTILEKCSLDAVTKAELSLAGIIL